MAARNTSILFDSGVLIRLDGERHGFWNTSGSNSSIAQQKISNSLSKGFASIKLGIENATEGTDEWETSMAALTSCSALHSQQTCGKAVTGKKAGLSSWTADHTAHDRGLASTGFPFSVGAVGSETSSRAKRYLSVRCLDARGLPLGSDSYCRIFWNGRQVGKTLLSSSLEHCPPTRSTISPPAWVSQRNPVWWTPSSFRGRGEDYRQTNLLSNQEGNAVDDAVIMLHERLDGAEELTVEVFDAFHKKADVDGKERAGERVEGSVRENESSTRNGQRELKRFRDVIGKSLGSITISGPRLMHPPKGRMDMALDTTSSFSDHNKMIVPCLSLTMECMSHEADDDEDASTDPFPSRVHNRRTTESPILGEDDVRTTPGKSGGMPKRWVRLLLGGVRLLHGLGLSGMRDPFCVVFFNRVWCEESRVCRGTLAPRWDHWVEIELCQGEAFVLGCAEVRVEVWDKGNAGGNDSFIGEATLFFFEDQDG